MHVHSARCSELHSPTICESARTHTFAVLACQYLYICRNIVQRLYIVTPTPFRLYSYPTLHPPSCCLFVRHLDFFRTGKHNNVIEYWYKKHGFSQIQDAEAASFILNCTVPTLVGLRGPVLSCYIFMALWGPLLVIQTDTAKLWSPRDPGHRKTMSLWFHIRSFRRWSVFCFLMSVDVFEEHTWSFKRKVQIGAFGMCYVT